MLSPTATPIAMAIEVVATSDKMAPAASEFWATASIPVYNWNPGTSGRIATPV